MVMAQECASVILQMVAQRLPHSLACTQLHIADSHAPTVCSSHRSFATRILQRLWPAHDPAGDTLAHKSASSGRDSLLLGMRTSGISLARHAPAGGAPISESQSLQETLRQISGAYRRNDLALESPLSGVVPQALSRYFGSDTKAAYVIKPKITTVGATILCYFFLEATWTTASYTPVCSAILKTPLLYA